MVTTLPLLVLIIIILTFYPIGVFAQEPSFDDLVESEEYTKIMDRLFELEQTVAGQKTANDDFWSSGERIAVISAGFATIAVVIFLGLQTLAQRNERKILFRSWISTEREISVKRYIDHEGKSYAKEFFDSLTLPQRSEIKLYSAEWYIGIKNSGQVPAVVKGRDATFVGKLPARKEIQKAKFGHDFVLMPGEIRQYLFERTYELTRELLAGRPHCYFIFEFRYYSEGNKTERIYGALINYSSAGTKIIDSWNERTFEQEPSEATIEYYKDNRKFTTTTDFDAEMS